MLPQSVRYGGSEELTADNSRLNLGPRQAQRLALGELKLMRPALYYNFNHSVFPTATGQWHSDLKIDDVSIFIAPTHGEVRHFQPHYLLPLVTISRANDTPAVL